MATPPFRVKALYDYSSPHDDDLSFPNGQVITVTDEEDADWYYGEYADAAGSKQEGLFPRNFVKTFEPETPPRPSRMSRSKKELEPPAVVSEADKAPATEEPEASSPQAAFAAAPVENTPAPERYPEEPHQQPMPSSKKDIPPAVPPTSIAAKPALPAASKPTPPPTAEKPASGSFRDRINAFNKPAAPPVAPSKPSGLGASGGSGFIKKPFVAPPPSKNAYVPPPREPPPQKFYRREEDPELVAQASHNDEDDELPASIQAAPSEDTEEDQPKPTSLKDRIALLQKQQMEQAARHAEGVQKKEKPKKPSRKQVDQEHPADQEEDLEGETLERMNSGETTGKRSIELSRDPPPGARSGTRPRKSRENTPVGSPVAIPARELLSDANDADQSGAGETEGEETSTGRDDSDEKPGRLSIPLQRSAQAPIREAESSDGEANEAEDDQEEEEHVDPEVKRRMEIRERMAKMSGGMGMAGMFGPPGGMSPRVPSKQNSASSERKATGNSVSGIADSPVSRAPPVPIMPMPGLQKVRSPEQSNAQTEVGKEDADVPRSVVHGRGPEDMFDVEDMKEEPVSPPPRRSVERPAPPPIPQDRPVPAPPTQVRAVPPLPTERVPHPPSESRPVQRPPPSQPMSPSEGSESDDEMSSHTRSLSLKVPPGADNSRPTSQEGPQHIASAVVLPSLPSRPAAPPSRSSDFGIRNSPAALNQMSPTSPTATFDPPPKRSSRVPPIPGSSSAMPSVPQSRAPPPPPPINIPPSRAPTGGSRMPPAIPKTAGPEESDEEITEYEGDYDTDMASGATHKDALKSHARVSSLEDDSMTEEASLHHSGLPSLGPPTSNAPRAVPPPPPPPNQPPHQPTKTNRQSSDMPRVAPPPLPKEQTDEGDDENYDPYRYAKPEIRGSEGAWAMEAGDQSTPMREEPDTYYSISPTQRSVPPPVAQNTSQHATSPKMSAPGRSVPRQSLDVQRTSTSIRRSTDVPRPSGEQSIIAGDVELGQGSKWWARPDTPPPVFQNRRDVMFETEETSNTRRGGKQTIMKVVYVLFMDYSQTVITAHFEAKEPANASLEQRHEPPPPRLRQDQLENAHTRFGSHIAEAANSKKETVVGDGSPHGLILDLLSGLSEALLPVGVRAYGALVYANIANATVQQFDEIRPGDIVTFRNAKFQGHRGPMHSKYAVEVGKPDHVGVVIDWDGTKKKVRAWEQGRESKKVKPESYKFGDMRSGEVKVWRVMARSWVGWEGQN